MKYFNNGILFSLLFVSYSLLPSIGAANELKLDKPILAGVLVRTSVTASANNRAALPDSTIGEVKQRAKEAFSSAGFFSGEGDAKYILKVRAEKQDWACTTVGEPIYMGGEASHYRVGQLSDTFEFQLLQIRPHKQLIFESKIPVIDRQKYGMERYCVAGWHEAQSKRAALNAIDMFTLQLMGFAGLEVEEHIKAASDSMLRVGAIDAQESIRAAIIHTVEFGADLVSGLASAVADVANALGDSDAFNRMHVQGLHVNNNVTGADQYFKQIYKNASRVRNNAALEQKDAASKNIADYLVRQNALSEQRALQKKQHCKSQGGRYDDSSKNCMIINERTTFIGQGFESHKIQTESPVSLPSQLVSKSVRAGGIENESGPSIINKHGKNIPSVDNTTNTVNVPSKKKKAWLSACDVPRFTDAKYTAHSQNIAEGFARRIAQTEMIETCDDLGKRLGYAAYEMRESISHDPGGYCDEHPDREASERWQCVYKYHFSCECYGYEDDW